MKVILIVIAVALVTAIPLFVVFDKEKSKSVLLLHRIERKDLSERHKILKDSVADLEEKARILNRYLRIKHLEYIEVYKFVNNS